MKIVCEVCASANCPHYSADRKRPCKYANSLAFIHIVSRETERYEPEDVPKYCPYRTEMAVCQEEQT
jgi:hypothetical protein